MGSFSCCACSAARDEEAGVSIISLNKTISKSATYPRDSDSKTQSEERRYLDAQNLEKSSLKHISIPQEPVASNVLAEN